MKNRFAFFLLAGLVLQLLPSSPPVFAEETIVEGTGSIQILQDGPSKNALGSWTLIQPDNSQVNLDKKYEFTLAEAPSGNYVLLIDKANGTSIELKIYKNDTLIETSDDPQATFSVSNGDSVRLEAKYAYTLTGIVGVSSTPTNVPFILEDSNGTVYNGRTPESFDGVPIGIFSVTYKPPKECPQPAPQSDQLLENGRISFSVELSCDELDDSEEYSKQLKYVTILDDGKNIVLDDAPIDAWFAPYVHTVAKTGIMSGYRDASGNYTGKFGPANPVSIAQLVKVAHEVAGINETETRGTPRNTRAHGTWFEQYYVSAEQQYWQVFQDSRMDPGRNATRAEVITTILQAMDVPRLWPRGEFFSDVTPLTKYSSSIETAAIDGIISTDSGTFRPNDSINRAELAKIISLAIEMYIEDSPEFTGESH